MIEVTIEAVYYLTFGFGVYGTKAIIEHNNLRVFYQGTCNRNTLFLATAKGYTSLSDHRIVSFFKALYLFMYAGKAGCLLYYLSVSSSGEAKADIVGYAITK